MVHNVKSFLKNYLVYFPIALGVWQILKFTPPAAVIRGVMRWLLWLAFPGFFPAYERLRHFPGCVFKTVKCVVLTKGMSQSKTKPLTNPKNQVTTTHQYHMSAYPSSESKMSTVRTMNTQAESKMSTGTILNSNGESKPADSKMSTITTLNSNGESKPADSKMSTITTLNSNGESKPQADSKMSTRTTLNSNGESKPQADSSKSKMPTTTTLNSNGESKPQADSSKSKMPTTTTLNSNGESKPEAESSTGAPQAKSISVCYLGETFKVEREGNKVETFKVEREGNTVSVREWSYYNVSDGQWEKICNMEKKCFKKAGKGPEKENEVVFVKGCQYIWQKVATGQVMEFGEVLDDVIFENNDTVLMSDNNWFLPVDLSEKSEGKLPKLLNLVGLIPRVSNAPFLYPISLTIAAAVLEFSESLRSLIYETIHKMFCGLVQYICNKLPYSARKCVYLFFIWVENMKPRNDIRLKVERRMSLNVFIGGAAKTNSPQEPTLVDWLDPDKEGEYKFRCGCSIDMKATYEADTRKCKATVQHTNARFGAEERVFIKCQPGEEFRRIGTLLSCLAASKAGSLFKYDCNDDKVHVHSFRRSLRRYKEAGFPEIYKLRLHDVIV